MIGSRTTRLCCGLFVTLTAIVAPSTIAAAAEACPALDCSGGGSVSTTTSGFRYVFNGSAFFQVPISTGGNTISTDPKVKYEYFYQTDCPGAAPVTAGGDIGDLSCNQDGTACANSGGILLLVWYRPEGSNDAPVASPNPICTQGNTKITLPQLTTIIDTHVIDYLQNKDLNQPSISVQPAQTALVNLPTIMSMTPDSGQLQVPILDPIPGTLDLVPTYSWDFGDGAAGTPTVAGRPYDGTNPEAEPLHYPVQHTFRKADTFQVKGSVTWTATTLHLPGFGDFPINQTHVFDATANIPVHEAHAVLVSGDEGH